MPDLVMVMGANGAGKTTWAREHRAALPEDFYEADSVAQGLGSYDNPRLSREARRLIDHRIGAHLQEETTFGLETTYSGTTRPRLVEDAADRGYRIHVVFLGTHTFEINVDRVKARVRRKIGHAIENDELLRRWSACQRNLQATAARMENIYILDNSGAAPTLVASVHEGSEPRYTTTEVPWARRLAERIRSSGS